jgi:hypothetical protein
MHGDRGLQEDIFALIRRCNSHSGTLRTCQILVNAVAHAQLNIDASIRWLRMTDDEALRGYLEDYADFLDDARKVADVVLDECDE